MNQAAPRVVEQTVVLWGLCPGPHANWIVGGWHTAHSTMRSVVRVDKLRRGVAEI
jgi:hypothetical protein